MKIRWSVVVVTLSMTLMACLTTEADRQLYIGPSSDHCRSNEGSCTSSKECCSDWCAAGACTVRGGGG